MMFKGFVDVKSAYKPFVAISSRLTSFFAKIPGLAINQLHLCRLCHTFQPKTLISNLFKLTDFNKKQDYLFKIAMSLRKFFIHRLAVNKRFPSLSVSVSVSVSLCVFVSLSVCLSIYFSQFLFLFL